MILPYLCIENNIRRKGFENLKSPLDDMYSHKKKTEENKSRANASSVAQKKSSERQGFGFVDNRTCTETQKSLQLMMNNRYQLVEQKQPSQRISGSLIQNKEKNHIMQMYSLKLGASEFLQEREFAQNKRAIQFSFFDSCIGVVGTKGGKVSGVHLVLSVLNETFEMIPINNDAKKTAKAVNAALGDYDEVVVIGCVNEWEGDTENSSLFMEELKKLTGYNNKNNGQGYWRVSYSDGWKITEKEKKEMDPLWKKYNKENIIAHKAKDIAAEYGMMYGWSDAYEKQYAESEEARERAIARIEGSLEPKPSYII
jgi:hypothetical protein